MKIEQLLDQLDTLLDEGMRVPFTNKVMLEEDVLERITDDLRHALPQEVTEAKKIVADRQAILDEAQKEAQHIMDQAKGYVAKLTEESLITKQAQEQANELMQEARTNAKELQLEANKYAFDVLRQLEINLEKALETVRQGRNGLHAGK
ncbi:MAG TPA: ATPase [Firmicutes bacterium]|nr:ATPase [Bacillota bacterium]